MKQVCAYSSYFCPTKREKQNFSSETRCVAAIPLGIDAELGCDAPQWPTLLLQRDGDSS